MKLTATMDTTNAAFEDAGVGAPEVMRLLRHMLNRFDTYGDREGRFVDSNGNTVGTWTVTEEE